MKRISGFQKTENTKDGANPTLVNERIDNTAYEVIKQVYDELPQLQEYSLNMDELRAILSQIDSNAEKAYKWAENPFDDEVEPGKYSAKHWAILAQNRVSELQNLSIAVSLVDPTYPATSTYDSSTGILRIAIPQGVGIQSITRIAGENLPGTKDTYQITYTDNSTSIFEVYNGQDGVSITDITKINGDSSSGSIDTYRINKSDGTYSSINVYNGKDGVSVLSFSKLSGTGEPGTDDVYRLTLSDGSYTDITIHQGRDTTGDMEKSVYDTNNDGIVDKADDALKLNGQTSDYYGKQSDIDALNTSVNTLSTNKEDKSNKVTTFQPTPDNEHYPSEKLVKDQLDTKSDKGHTHTEADITDLDKYTQSEVDSKLATKANTTDVYTQTEIDDKLALKANASSIYSRATIDDKLATKIDLTEKGSANGVATLDENAKVPASQLPSFVDDVLEVDTLPSTGETGKLYVLTTTNQVFRWSGSSFIEISVGTGTADAAVKLAAPRNIAISGDATGSTSFDGTSDVTINLAVANSDKLDGMQPNELPISDATQSALNSKANTTLDNVNDIDILNKIKNVDGAGSGLDADFLDGREASSFADASHTHQISDVTGLQDALDSKADATSTNSSLAAKEDKANKVTSWSSSPSDTNYPSELLVKSSLDAKADAANVYSKSTVDGMLTNKADKNLGNVAASDVLNKVKAVGGSGSGLDADLLDGMHAAQFTRAVASASANVGAGWITVAKNVSGRHYGRIIVTDQDSGDHAFIEIDWMRSFADSNFTVINVGGHGRRITGVRILEESGNVTYGTKLLQVYVTTQSTYTVTVITDHEHAGWSRHDVVTPVVQNSISGYAVKGYTVTRLDVANIATRSDIEVGGAVRTAGGLIVDGRWTVSADGNTLYEGGVALSSKYLGKTAKAADSAKLNGLGNSTSASANTIAQRDGAGDITARLFRTTYGAQTTPPPSTAEFFFRKSRTDNYMRPLSAQAFIQWLQDQGVGMAIKNTFWVDQLWVNNSETKVIDIGFSPSDWCKVYVSGGRYYGGPTGGGFLNNRLNPSNIAYSAVQLGSEYIWVFPYSANQVAIRNDSGGRSSFRLTVVEFS